ncbi:hypothetical protein CLI64_27910 [Nostoc sp. CENA543]|uniref:hypothetical protein n=1 Tax=Nostoc sp. CENA543 TaxID=1869241 RepID=UPI000CA2D8B4|nr:hypothetical protein [Nostoc sp. CENA543]AUT03905.1 hypothetical protein CLI64_27910 [Nostoc sp. CENA543]
MATLNIPDDLYAQLQELANAENSSIEAQAITVLQKGLQVNTQPKDEEKRKNVLKILEESSRNRRRLNPADFGLPDSTELLREDRNR